SMVNLLHIDLVLGMIVHDFRKVFIDLKEDINTKTVVGGINKSPVMLFTESYSLWIFIKPSCSSTNHRNSIFQAKCYIVKGRIRNAKVNGYIGFRDICCGTIDVNFSNNFMTTTKGNLFNHFPHFPIP